MLALRRPWATDLMSTASATRNSIIPAGRSRRAAVRSIGPTPAISQAAPPSMRLVLRGGGVDVDDHAGPDRLDRDPRIARRGLRGAGHGDQPVPGVLVARLAAALGTRLAEGAVAKAVPHRFELGCFLVGAERLETRHRIRRRLRSR